MIFLGDSSACGIITEIWYSLLLSERSYNYLCEALRGLIALQNSRELMSTTAGLIKLNKSHFNELHEVWKRWLKLPVTGISRIRKQRHEAMDADSGSSTGKTNYYRCIPEEHVPAAKKYMEDGIFQRTQKCSFAENPTLTGPPILMKDGAFTYCCIPNIIPFAGWDYVEVKKFKYHKSPVTMYGCYIESKLAIFMEKIASKQVTFHIILEDCVKIEEFLDKDTTYDRILTSNIMDYILLPELLRYMIYFSILVFKLNLVQI